MQLGQPVGVINVIRAPDLKVPEDSDEASTDEVVVVPEDYPHPSREGFVPEPVSAGT